MISRPEELYCVSESVWLRNFKGGCKDPIWAVEPLDGRTDIRNYAIDSAPLISLVLEIQMFSFVNKEVSGIKFTLKFLDHEHNSEYI
jgi:hypothetical protein